MTSLIFSFDTKFASRLCCQTIQKHTLAMCPISCWLAGLCLGLQYNISARSKCLVKIFSTVLIHGQLLGSYKVETEDGL